MRYLLMILLSTTCLLFSAELTITQLDVGNDLTAIKAEIKDVNGKLCGVVRIYTSFTDLAFESSPSPMTVESKDGETQVFLSPGTRMLRVVKKNFAKKEWVFPSSIESGGVFKIELSASGQKLEDNEQAAANYKTAEMYYSQNNFTDAEFYLRSAIDYIGKTNLKIQALLVKCLIKQNKEAKVKQELNTYFSLNPDYNLAEYEEFLALSNKYKKMEYDEKQMYSQAQDNLYKLRAYLKAYPSGLYKEDVQNSIIELDKSTYNSISSKQDCKNYLSNFPDGQYRTEATDKIAYYEAEEERAVYNNCISKYDYQRYLSNYSSGKFRSDANQQIARIEKEEKIEYNRKQRASNLQYAKEYSSESRTYLAKGFFSILLDAGIAYGILEAKDATEGTDAQELMYPVYGFAAGTLLTFWMDGSLLGTNFIWYFRQAGKYSGMSNDARREAESYSLVPTYNPFNNEVKLTLSYNLR